MPDPLAAKPTVDNLYALHARVVTDQTLDRRYAKPLSNVDKAAFLCAILNIEIDDLDLNEAYPLGEWLASADASLLRCGVYICDMRRHFYGLVIGEDLKSAPSKVWNAHAEAEHWEMRFDMKLYQFGTGEAAPEWRKVH